MATACRFWGEVRVSATLRGGAACLHSEGLEDYLSNLPRAQMPAMAGGTAQDSETMTQAVNTVRYLAISWRPWQWVKNLFVLAPLFFSANFLDIRISIASATGFVVFCLLSSSVYLLNDLADIERDRNHPVKGKRPLAAGKLAPSVASAALAVMVAVSLVSAWVLDLRFFAAGVLYMSLNLAYSFGLKRIVVVDVVCVALGFVLRVYAGSFLAQVDPTVWILMSTFFLALFLALGKRRGELLDTEVGEAGQRATLMHYEVEFLNSAIAIAATSAVMCYALFCLSDYAAEKFQGAPVYLTIPLVALGVLRYLHVIYHHKEGHDPTMALLRDIPLLLTIGIWFIAIVTMIAVAAVQSTAKG
jgi:decaprenyl-phosphate phosphoribosyltransferase